jgi:hypothetical protein
MAGTLTQYKARVAGIRNRYRATNDEIERKVAIAAAAALIGWGERSKVIGIEWFGVPSKVVLAIGGYLLAYNSTGTTRRLANAASDAASATYAYNAAKSAAFIAGDDDIGGEVVEVQGDEI